MAWKRQGLAALLAQPLICGVFWSSNDKTLHLAHDSSHHRGLVKYFCCGWSIWYSAVLTEYSLSLRRAVGVKMLYSLIHCWLHFTRMAICLTPSILHRTGRTRKDVENGYFFSAEINRASYHLKDKLQSLRFSFPLKRWYMFPVQMCWLSIVFRVEAHTGFNLTVSYE